MDVRDVVVRDSDGEDVREADGEDADDSAASSSRSSVTGVLRVARPARGPGAALASLCSRSWFANGVGAGRRGVPIAANSRAREIARRAGIELRTPPRAMSRRNLASATRSRRVDCGARVAPTSGVVLESSAPTPRRPRFVAARNATRSERVESTRDDVPRRGDARDDRGGALRVRERRVESRRRVAHARRAAASEEAARRVEEERAAEKTTFETEIAHLRTRLESARRTLRVSTRGG